MEIYGIFVEEIFHLDGKIPEDSWMGSSELMELWRLLETNSWMRSLELRELWRLRLLLLETNSWMEFGINGSMEIIFIGDYIYWKSDSWMRSVGIINGESFLN
jgi:hypothetical protein